MGLKMKMGIVVVLLVQCGLFLFGMGQITQPGTVSQLVGWFNITANLVFGAINAVMLFRLFRD